MSRLFRFPQPSLASGIAGADAFYLAEMAGAPELPIPAEVADKGVFLATCPPKAQEYITAIRTELQK